MSRHGDGPTCRTIPAHGRTYLMRDGRAWCPNVEHDAGPAGDAWGEAPAVAVAEPETPLGRRRWSSRPARPGGDE